MKKKTLQAITGLLVAGLLGTQVWAGEITYAPVNPNFGGSPFNGASLLSNAGSQNGFEAPPRDARDSAADFVERLDRTLLSRLSRALTSNILNAEGELIEGNFSTGLNSVNVAFEGNFVVVTITNPSTGETSVIRTAR